MSFFEVDGWDVPSHVISTASSSKKRKREAHPHDLPSGKHGARNESGKQLKSKEKSPQKQKSRKHAKSGRSKEQEPTRSILKDTEVGITPAKTDNNKNRKAPSKAKTKDVPMTDLQATMKTSLEGARFRWINEVLYTTNSSKSHEMIRDDPSVFQEYHNGFRRQVLSWPENPVQQFIATLSNSPRGTVIVDLGCGEAALAKSLIPEGICVLSYDLIRFPPYVMEADICQHIPLPGSEETDEGHVVDVCVCALSLMSTNWVGCIRECRRILKTNGTLRIAEVTSRFTDINAFVDLISDVGFKLKSKNGSNTHFILFEFTKTSCEPISEHRWSQIAARHDILKPCEYKRR